MRSAILSIRDRLDRVGVVISGLCALHCIAGLVLVTVLGLGGEALLSPAIHRVGLAVAVAVGAFTLGLGALRHGKRGPLLIGIVGLILMATSLFVSHGAAEAFLTIPGVALVAFAHIRNLRHAA
ncbi:MAG: MerC domain-containing protein [Novosphingobium sp.]